MTVMMALKMGADGTDHHQPRAIVNANGAQPDQLGPFMHGP